MLDELTAVRVAELYYDDNKTQDEIGTLLGLTRWKIGRLLAQARDEGIVRIEIVHPRARKLSLERALKERFGIVDAIVVPAPDEEAEILPRVAGAAADYLSALQPPLVSLGLSWGRTLNEVAQKLEQGWARGVTVVQINGGVTLNKEAGTAATTAAMIADKANGQAVLLPSPAILERPETKAAIEADRTVAGVLAMAGDVDAYLFSAGVVDETSVHVEGGYLSKQEIWELVHKGAVGDVVGRYVDASGSIVDESLNERTLGVSVDHLRTAKYAIFVVAGATKHAIARAVVSNGLCSVLVTDEATAVSLMEETP
jgi:deoxyribonucleoside regulator